MSQLIFIYNADSGTWNALFDAAHKIISPETYSCSLCALTYGSLVEKKAWKSFRETSDIDMQFLHKDEFENQYPGLKIAYPAVMKSETGQMKVVINSEKLDGLNNLPELIEMVKELDHSSNQEE